MPDESRPVSDVAAIPDGWIIERELGGLWLRHRSQWDGVSLSPEEARQLARALLYRLSRNHTAGQEPCD